jgi:small subunit ribosomal protein S18
MRKLNFIGGGQNGGGGNVGNSQSPQVDGSFNVDYKDVRFLSKFTSEGGKIIPSRINSLSVKRQRKVTEAIKRARGLALIPFVNR